MTNDAPSPPSARARALVEGAYDTHIHVAPDVMRRRIDDVDLARRFADVGITRAARGALLERCFTTPHTGKVSRRQLLDTIRAVGPEHSVLSSDLGQPFNPPVEDGLALMADTLLEDGFGEDEIRMMAVVNSRRVASEDPR
jgi:hypothetical protein